MAILGLEKENVRRLKHGQPIEVDLMPLCGVNAVVVIMYGDTAEDMYQALKATGRPMPPMEKGDGRGS